MMGFSEFEVQFDNPDATYVPGQTITGKILLTVDSTKSLKAIKVTVAGIARVEWSGSRNTKYSAKEEYFKTQFSVLGSETGRWFWGSKIELSAGSYTYPFSFDLMPNLPSSFESEVGFIKYTVKAIIDRPWKINQETKADFTVVSSLDLNQLSYASEPITIKKSKSFCCLYCRSPPLSIVVKIPVKGYVSGQSIPVKVEIDNESGVRINKVKVVLQKSVTYTASSGKKKIEHAVLKMMSTGPIGREENMSCEKCLEVPSVHPSNLQRCKIIDLEYTLKTEVCVSGFYRSNLVVNTPIIIGTVPLINYETPPPQNDSNNLDTNFLANHFPTAPPPEERHIYCSSALNNYSCMAPSFYGERMFSTGSGINCNRSIFPRYPVYSFICT